LLLLFAAQYLPGAPNVRIEAAGRGGPLLLRDYDTGRQWPVEVAQAALVQRGLLPVTNDDFPGGER
jgi:hypothetical protein